ncbi:transketolase family protein [Actinomadura hibisca]|uniref:transketolase family protein n=1 Tax=Actinomadura hibisca TaxID=68565 RepID=UPI00082D7449|nr:transketolase C-terminal domain-containing protein [Actinomadura hibisca]
MSARACRDAYRDLVPELLAADARAVCLDSDTGLFAGIDFGGTAARYVNLGIAEQNLMGVAAGLAQSGFVPYVNTMAAFAATRALEAVKIDIALCGLPVRIMATHDGLAAGHLGPTHHSLEDLAVMRLLPGMTVLVPHAASAAEELIRQCADVPGPVYMRLGRKAAPEPPPGLEPLRLGRAQPLRDGGDVTIAATGPYPVLAALGAADLLAADGVQARVLNVHTVRPLDVQAILNGSPVVTVEEHWASGGLGSAVAEAAAELPDGPRVLRVAVPDAFVPGAGDQAYLVARAGITPEAVADRARRALGISAT